MENNTNSKTIFANSFKELMNTKSISKITVLDLVSHSNLSRQTFYRYFNSIDDLIYYIHYNIVSPVYKLSASLSDNRIAFKLYLDLMKENKFFYQQIITLDGYSSFTREYYLKTKENLMKYMFDGYNEQINNDPDLTFALNFYIRSFTSTILEWVKTNNNYTSEYLTKALVEFMPEKLKSFVPPLYQYFLCP